MLGNREVKMNKKFNDTTEFWKWFSVGAFAIGVYLGVFADPILDFLMRVK